MDNTLQVLLSYQFLLFCLAVSATTYIITVIVNYIFSTKGRVIKDNVLWSSLILPILPVILGCLGAVAAKQYPYPVEITSLSGRAAFGLVSGLLAGLVWRWVKAIISHKMASFIGKKEDDYNDVSVGIVDDTEKKE